MNRRANDQLLNSILTNNKEDPIKTLISMYKEIEKWKKDGYKIMAVKEKLTTLELKDILCF